ncbi:MAG: hypothetical protein N2692_03180, partial [Patescibacteria group bacterium]|nr:hypothetical protein [Patescibacteria group bacterium]
MDTKRMAKLEASKLIAQLLQSEDMEVLDGVDFGFTEGSLLLRGAVCDIQIKLITPSAKTGTRYPKLEEDGKEVEDYSSTFFCLEFSENSKNLKFFEYLFFFKLCEFSENSKNLKFFEYLFFFKLCEF